MKRKLLRKGWTRMHNRWFIPDILYKTRKEAREAIAKVHDRENYVVMKVELWRTA